MASGSQPGGFNQHLDTPISDLYSAFSRHTAATGMKATDRGMKWKLSASVAEQQIPGLPERSCVDKIAGEVSLRSYRMLTMILPVNC